ncbi:MAG: hypothetical protein EXX96DRAFT_475361 [Benjaminiella poitrasii]|nr:MAG: hypothetical protein EXX96DRAFT_475361 [Benjaminiella poitrasii]
MSSSNVCIDPDFELLQSTPQSNASSASLATTTTQEPWNKVRSSYAAKRKQIQAERMRQLKELEEQLDLGDATLEELEGLIAASAKRLASYRLRNQKNENQSQDSSPLPMSTSSKKWRELLEHKHNSNNSAIRLSNNSSSLLSKHHNSDLRVEDQTFITALSSSPSETEDGKYPPKISLSTTPRVTSSTHLRKATRSFNNQQQQQQQQQQHELVEGKHNDVKAVEEYINSVKKLSTKLHQNNNLEKRKVKLSITTANISSSTGSSTTKTSAGMTNSASSTTATAVRRKRGKTLPGNLTSQPSIAPISLPPMKVEPLSIPSVQKSTRTIAKTPTRIPLPSTTAIPASIIPKKKSSKRINSNNILTEIKHQQPRRQLRKPKSTSMVSTTPKLQASRSNKSTDDNTLRKITAKTTPTSSATTNHISKSTSVNELTHSVLSKSISGSTSKRKVSTLQERLQNLVDESKSWTSQMERDKINNKSIIVDIHNTSEIVIRGRGLNATPSNKSVEEPIVTRKLLGEHPKVTMRVAMTPEAALKLYQFNLTSYERQEMVNYESVYFVGHHAKKRPTSPTQAICNYGYDDERGDYLILLRDHLDYRYEVLEVMGKGSFGQVLKCFDHRTSQTVAVKIIRNKKRFHAQALVEVKILEDLIAWDPEDRYNNIRMMEHFVFRNHLCIAFECLSINLYEFIKSNGFQGFSMGLIRRFAMQLLNSLVLLQKHKLIHCDLKPEVFYTYIQSRFYRSPEVILGMNYSMAIDMWSLGYSQGNPRIQPNSKGRKRRPGTKSLEHALKTADETFIDFINKCLCWDPEQRMKPDEALKHPWMIKASSRKHTSSR